MEYQHQWNKFKQGKYEVNEINIASVPIFKPIVFASTFMVATTDKNDEKKDAQAQEVVQMKKTKCARTSFARVPSLEIEATEEEIEDEVSHIQEEQSH